VDATDRAQFEGIARDVANAAVAVATGDWTPLPVVEERSRVSRIVTIGRRLLAPTVLSLAAVVVPRLPGVTMTGSAATSLQAALFVTAVLSLTSLDPSSREQILGAFNDIHRRP
jgi:hypothetical protein